MGIDEELIGQQIHNVAFKHRSAVIIINGMIADKIVFHPLLLLLSGRGCTYRNLLENLS